MSTIRNVKFAMKVESGDDAMTADYFGELHTMLTHVVERIRTGSTMGTLWDSNGNMVGSWNLALEEDEEDEEEDSEDV